MIHKVKYGLMEVVLDTGEHDRVPDLVFKGARDRGFAVFFAPYGTVEGERMKGGYYDYYAPFEVEALAKEELDAEA